MPNRNVEGNYRYGYQGQYAEKEPELGTGINSFELRLWDSRIGRWLSPDPYGQFASPYLGMGNNPVNGVDPDGGCFTTDTDGKSIPCPDMGAGSTMIGAAGYEWTMFEDGWGRSDGYAVDLGTVLGARKPFSISNWIKEHVYFNAEAGVDYGTQIGGNFKLLGLRGSANFKKDVDPLIKIGTSYDQGWDPVLVPGENMHRTHTKNEWNIGLLVGVGEKYESSRSLFNLKDGALKSQTSDWIIISITEEYHTYGPHKGLVKNRKYGWGVGADIAILLGINFDLSGGLQFKTKNN